MATRPVFLPSLSPPPFVEERAIEFRWFPGFSKSQAQKSIRSLHTSAAAEGISPVLEISSKSPEELGIGLSAFNLQLCFPEGKKISVECAFQGSKIFTEGGPYTDLYFVSSREAKKDGRLRSSGDLIGFDFSGLRFPTEPKTAFYDWLYLSALKQNPDVRSLLLDYQGFTDIAFNPMRSINCQARSAALYVSLRRSELFDIAMRNSHAFLSVLAGQQPPLQEPHPVSQQLDLFQDCPCDE